MKRIALVIVLVFLVCSLGPAQTRYASNVMSFSDTATTAWQSYLVDTVKTYLVKNYYDLEVKLLSGGDLYYALTVADTASAGAFNILRKNQTLQGADAPMSFYVGPTTSTRLWYKSASTSIFEFNFK